MLSLYKPEGIPLLYNWEMCWGK